MVTETRRQERLAIVGTGGHAREIAWLAESCGYARDALVFLVDETYFTHRRINGILVETFESGACDGFPCVVAIGDPTARAAVRARCTARDMRIASLVAPDTILHDTVHLAPGVVIAPGAVITVNVSLGEDVHVNVCASISHDVSIGRFSTLSPGARIAGHVHIGESVFIGANATIINGTPDKPLLIGDRAIIAAGACVIGPVAQGETVVGVPARSRG
ncbi:NeuD/PglB/VioB family sugar acetyltransferase [Luteibacter aegosomaticola]|uniref:NeuD/PglB/VioB family sugar acetyltransferase n=1 Tax=Luteibacter aegosomaticola TaxID=2911538 RepID=UPI001FF81CB9|nr:NeuD/PglB/VioB family sugar acetyltransferase [Luteibacter aegosomaticola]UPG91442.1 NeuD/PglB/VioB family sugar acetyltransferase [Luteibacter aegosomaticola]